MIYAFATCRLDTDRFELRVDGENVPVEPQVFDVLAYLIERHDRVVSKEELLDNVWGDRFVSESALTSRIKAARRAVGDDGRAQRVIRTVHGRGYHFVAPLDEPRADPDADRGDPSQSGQPDRSPRSDRPRTRYAWAGEHAVAYQVVGEGEETIVFIPGFVSNVELQWEIEPFASFFESLSALGRLVVFDKYGTGLSDRLGASEIPTLEERMDAVRAVLDKVGCERATLFGVSEGGPMALLFAATYPERVDRLILYGTYACSPFETDARGEEFAVLAERFWGTGTCYGALAPSVARDIEQRRRFGRYEVNAATPRGAAELIRLTNTIDVRSTLPAVSSPTLILHRVDETIVPVERARELAAGIAGARLVELAGEDHLAFVGDTDALLAEVQSFLGHAPRLSPPERHLATIVLIATGDDDASDTDRNGWRHLHHRIVADHEGRVVDAPPGLLGATFGGPARAVLAAGGVVREIGDGSRAGVHTAEVELAEGSVTGLGVDITRSLAELAGAGEVLVSRTVRDLVAGSALRFSDRGAHALAGLDETWQVYATVEPATAGS